MVISRPDRFKRVFVAYLATFGGRERLPIAIDPVFWIPVLPAVAEEGDRNVYEPMSSINGVPQWISIRKRIAIKQEEVSTCTGRWRELNV